MKTLTIQIPETVDLNEKQAVMYLAAKLYEVGKLSLGQAAELAGFSKRAFMEVLGHYGVSIFNYSPEDLENDITTLRNYHK